MNRISKDKYYLNIAREVARRSPCLRRKIGSILVRDDCILSTGYNGVPRGDEHCKFCIRISNNVPHGAEYRGCPAIHSEVNAIINAARTGTNIIGSVLYISAIDEDGSEISVPPCYRCKRIIKNADIVDVIIEDKHG